MRRNIIVFLIIFLAFPYLVYSITTFVIQETDKLSLQTNATDPDRDKLTITYSSPLNENGEWQTTYGDAGNYKSVITASDGQANATEEILIVVRRKEEPPKIDIYSPVEDPVRIKELEIVKFYVNAIDLNMDELSYKWYIDNKKSGEDQRYSYRSSYNDAGLHKVVVEVSDNLHTVSKEWTIEVEDFNIQRILDGIEDVTVNENEVARLSLPDFEAYGLSYSISEPIGNDNEWQTGYEDQGKYNVRVEAEGYGFKGFTDVEVNVKNVDRPPVFEKLDNKIIDENNALTITLKASDPDGNDLEFSANKLPEGAILKDNLFTWTPSFDTVKKEDFIDRIVDKFTVLSRNFYIQFTASSLDKKVVQNVLITVKDVNRAPVLEEIPAITVNEGDTINIVPSAYDPDGDKIRFIYSGFMDRSTFKTGLYDAGDHKVTVTASDGSLQSSRDVQITVKETNRAPVFSKISDKKALENDNIAILLDAKDPDGDSLSYSLLEPPQNSSIKDNAFFWTPGFDTVGSREKKKFDLAFVVTDGKSEAKQIAHIEVENKNRLPRIVNASRSLVADVNEPVFMFVKAVDDDNDKLTYTWDFGLLEKYEATDKHQRTFASPGTKEIKVIVSDGTDKIEQPINVYVRGNITSDRYKSERLTVNVVNLTIRKETRVSTQVVSPEVAISSNVPPKITDSTSYVLAKVNEPVLMYVKAVDDNGDKLTYTWDFGFLDKHQGQYHQRTFTSTGVKTATVTVSDGTYSVKQILTINVV